AIERLDDDRYRLGDGVMASAMAGSALSTTTVHIDQASNVGSPGEIGRAGRGPLRIASVGLLKAHWRVLLRLLFPLFAGRLPSFSLVRQCGEHTLRGSSNIHT